MSMTTTMAPAPASAASSDVPVVSRKVNVKTGNGKVVGVVREHYLRDDVPCGSELCFEGCHNGGDVDDDDGRAGGRLPADVTHYLVPMEDVVRNFFDVLESPDLRGGVIYLQSVVAPVQLSSQRHYRRVCARVRDPSARSTFFPNEFCRSAHVPRRGGEDIAAWRTRAAYRATEWYYEHLGGQKPVVVVTENEQVVKEYGSKRVEIFVVSLGDYLDKFWPGLTALKDTYDSVVVARSKDSSGKADQADYAEYLRQEVLEAGLKKGKFLQGRLQVNKHHSASEAFVVRQGDSKKKAAGVESDDVLVAGATHRNRAVHGDVVVVELLPKSEWKSRLNRLTDSKKEDDDYDDDGKKGKDGGEWERRADVCPTGRVVGVAQRNWREYVATIPSAEADAENMQQKRSGRRVLVAPYDRRIPRIRVLTSQMARLAGQRIVVSIDSWPSNSRYPNGHFVRALGKAGDLETELDGILLENSISVTPFSQGILREMPAADAWTPDEDGEVKNNRRDLRESHSAVTMSIDPVGCEDVDDALSVRKLEGGDIVELGVHIADVSHFVAAGSLADAEAAARATTVYLADRRYDMLPSALSSNVCSLLGGVDRYAVSVIWRLDAATAEVRDVWYGRTVIRSAYKLFYEAAQDVIDGKWSPEEVQEDIPELKAHSGQGLRKKYRQLRETLQALTDVARKIQARRERDGALRLESSSEVRFEFEHTNLADIKPKEHLAVHETVAECMIFANHWVAKRIAASFPSNALLRRHPQPKKENFEELKRCAASRGWSVDVASNRALADSLNACVDPRDPSVNFLLRSLATYAMVQALYFSTGSANPEDWGHYGLALDRYTHFTSPIRRYADVVVHRLLLAAVGRGDADDVDWWADDGKKKAASAEASSLLENAKLQELSEHINERNRAAQLAQRESQSLFQTLFFRGKAADDPRCIVDAVVFSVRPNGFLVYVPRYALKGPVHMQQEAEAGKRQVLFYKKEVSGPVWTDGSLSHDENSLTVSDADGKKKQVYRVFDHVTVTIQLQESEAHAHRLRFYFLSNRRHADGGEGALRSGEMDFLQEIRTEMMGEEETKQGGSRESEEDDETSEGRKRSVKKNDCGGSNKMYRFFQQMKTVGISEKK